MKTETDSFSFASSDCDNRSLSEIISDLRTAFKLEDFECAEAVLVARETALRREIALLKKEKQSILEMRELERIERADLQDELARLEAGVADTAALRANLEAAQGRARLAEERLEQLQKDGISNTAAARERARAAEERLEKLLEHMKTEEKRNESLVSEMSELRKKAREAEEYAEKCEKEFKERIQLSQADVAALWTPNKNPRNSAPIVILDSDDDRDTIGESTEKESSYKFLKRKRSLSPNASGIQNDADIIRDIKQEPQAPPEPGISPADNKNPVKEASSSSNGAEQLNTISKHHQPDLDRVGKNTVAKKCPSARNFKLFWSQFDGTRVPAGSSPSDGSKK